METRMSIFTGTRAITEPGIHQNGIMIDLRARRPLLLNEGRKETVAKTTCFNGALEWDFEKKNTLTVSRRWRSAKGKTIDSVVHAVFRSDAKVNEENRHVQDGFLEFVNNSERRDQWRMMEPICIEIWTAMVEQYGEPV